MRRICARVIYEDEDEDEDGLRAREEGLRGKGRWE